jgi:hypothetical protein
MRAVSLWTFRLRDIRAGPDDNALLASVALANAHLPLSATRQTMTPVSLTMFLVTGSLTAEAEELT